MKCSHYTYTYKKQKSTVLKGKRRGVSEKKIGIVKPKLVLMSAVERENERERERENFAIAMN